MRALPQSEDGTCPLCPGKPGVIDWPGGVKTPQTVQRVNRRPSHLGIFFLVEANLEVDLFGNPSEPPQERRGRPAHRPTLETRNRVLLAFVRGLSEAQAAKLVGIDAKTLRKHYSRECSLRTTAALRMEMRQLERLNAQAEEGNVAAEKALAAMIDKFRARDLAEKLPRQRKAAARKGKKEQQQEAAQQVAGKFGTRPPPPALIN